MSNFTSKVRCLFGFHKYTIPHKGVPLILLCQYCERFGYCKYPDGSEAWREFNEKGNMIHSKWSSRDELWYDNKGNMTHRKWSSGDESWYDVQGNVTYSVNSYGVKFWSKFDAQGNKIYFKRSDGLEIWYDENGNVINLIGGK